MSDSPSRKPKDEGRFGKGVRVQVYLPPDFYKQLMRFKRKVAGKAESDSALLQRVIDDWMSGRGAGEPPEGAEVPRGIPPPPVPEKEGGVKHAPRFR